jgi:hypothetical protein
VGIRDQRANIDDAWARGNARCAPVAAAIDGLPPSASRVPITSDSVTSHFSTMT